MSRQFACGEWSVSVRQIATNAEVSLGALDRDPYSLSCVQSRALPIAVMIENAVLPGWRPRDEKDLRLAGQCFAELLFQLYDGRQWTLVIEPEIDVLERARWSPHNIGIKAIHTWSAVDPHGLEWQREFWRCPKSVLGDALQSVWTPHGPDGYAVRRKDIEGWRSCFDAERPAARLDRWLKRCLFVFEHTGHGAGLQMIGRELTVETVETAIAGSNVRRALQRLGERNL